MKKTLLAAAAILAVGCLASQAQVYSQNIVGYYNVTIPSGQYAMVSGQLLNSDGSNNVNNVFSTGVADLSQMLVWNGAGFEGYTYYSAADVGAQYAGWYDNSSGDFASNLVGPGTGVFIQAAADSTITVVGTVPQGAFTNLITAGYNIYSINAPVSTNIDSSLVGLPVSDQDQMLTWTGSGYEGYTYYSAADVGAQYAGWYDNSSGDYYTTNSASWPTVGSAFFIQHTGSTITWTNSLSF